MLLQLPGFLHLSFIDVVDIVLVALLIFAVFRWIKGSSAMNIFIAIILLLIGRILAVALDMKMTSSILGTILDVGAVALVVIFQPEIRRFLNNMGRSAGDTIGKKAFFSRFLPDKNGAAASSSSISGIVSACEEMAQQKTGALIVIARRGSLEDIISTGDIVDARIGSRLIMNIFFKNSPLHDGAMIIASDRIVAARCTLPISDRKDLPASYGMRHKAAVGLSEQCDADVIVVSEQTGKISFVRGGKVIPVPSMNELKLLISNAG